MSDSLRGALSSWDEIGSQLFFKIKTVGHQIIRPGC